MSTWLLAAATAAKLLGEGKTRQQILEGFHYEKDILKTIAKHELLNFSGRTPGNSLNQAINKDIKDNPHTSKFVRVQSPSKGYYALREEQLKEESDDEQPEEEEKQEEEEQQISEKRLIFELSDLLKKCQTEFTEARELTNTKIPSFLSKKIDSIIDKSSHERFRSQWARSNYRSVVVLGRTGVGKSFLLNALARILMQQYSEETHQHDTHIAGSLHQLIADIAEEYPTLNLDEFVESANKHRNSHEYFTNTKKQKEIFKQEKQVEELFKVYHENAMLSIMDKEEVLYKYPFFFPSKSEGGATTAFPTILRYGYVPALFVKFYSVYEEIEFPAHYGTREKYLQSWKVSKEEIQKYMGKNQAFIGQGKNSILDRVYIRDKYEEICNNKNAFLAIEKIYVYLPCLMLFDRFEIVDLPGFDDNNEVRMNHLLRYLKDAKIVWAVTNNNLESSAMLVNLIQESKILSKIIEDPVTYGLVIAHMPEKELNYPSKYIVAKHVITNKKIEEGTIDVLKDMVMHAYEDIENPFMDTKDALIEATLNKIERFSVWPFLFASVIEAKKKPPMDILEATGGLRLLGNIQKLLYGKLLDTMDHYIDEFASVTDDLSILSKSIKIEFKPPTSFFLKLEENEVKDFIYDIKYFKEEVDKACAEMVDSSLDDKFFPLSLYGDVTKAFLEAINEVSDSPPEEKRSKFNSFLSVILSRKRPQISRKILGNRINIRINQIIVEFAEYQWAGFNQQLLKYVSKDSKESLVEFLNYFKFFRLVLQSALEKQKPTVICGWAKNMYFNIFEEKFCAEKLNCDSPKSLEKVLRKINEETLHEVRTRAKGEVHKQIEKHFYKADNLQKTLKRCAKEYVSIILLNADRDSADTINKGELHNSFSALVPSVKKLQDSYKSLQEVRAAYRKINKLSSETTTIGKSVYGKNVRPPYYTQFVDCCLDGCKYGHEAVDDTMIQCDYCGIWFHLSCYREVDPDINTDTSPWICLYCQKPTVEVSEDEQSTQDDEGSQDTICYTTPKAKISPKKRKQPERSTKRTYDLTTTILDDDDDLDWETDF